MYKITDYTKKQADKLNVVVKPSKRKNKKIDVYNKNDGQYITSVGQLNYKDYPTHIQESGKAYADKRRICSISVSQRMLISLNQIHFMFLNYCGDLSF